MAKSFKDVLHESPKTDLDILVKTENLLSQTPKLRYGYLQICKTPQTRRRRSKPLNRSQNSFLAWNFASGCNITLRYFIFSNISASPPYLHLIMRLMLLRYLQYLLYLHLSTLLTINQLRNWISLLKYTVRQISFETGRGKHHWNKISEYFSIIFIQNILLQFQYTS